MRRANWLCVEAMFARWRRAVASWLRWLNGDTAYLRYLEHARAAHPGKQPLSRAAFYREETERRWNGVRRCC